MAFKQRSSGPFKMMGASPAKQGVWNTTKKVFGVAGKALKKYCDGSNKCALIWRKTWFKKVCRSDGMGQEFIFK